MASIGLEPILREEMDFESIASANSAKRPIAFLVWKSDQSTEYYRLILSVQPLCCRHHGFAGGCRGMCSNLKVGSTSPPVRDERVDSALPEFTDRATEPAKQLRRVNAASAQPIHLTHLQFGYRIQLAF